jgi:hypothetical protein
MLQNSENKMMDAAEPKDDVTFKGVMQDFFFPGSGTWKPVTIHAESREAAEELWKSQRELSEPTKAEEQTNNE